MSWMKTPKASRGLLAGALVAALLVAGARQAHAGVITPGMFSMNSAFSNSHNPTVGLLGYNGTSFYSPGPVDNLDVVINGTTTTFTGVTFSISGFNALSTTVSDDDSSGDISVGDFVRTKIGSGGFVFKDSSGQIIINGVFNKATFTSQIGESSGSLFAVESQGLSLTAGPGFVVGGYVVSSIATPEGFSIALPNLVGISASTLGPSTFDPDSVVAAKLASFAAADGSVVTSGKAAIVVGSVPEPASLGLLGLGAMGLLARRKS